MAPTLPRLTTLDGWVELVQSREFRLRHPLMEGELYCPTCGGMRRVDVSVIFHQHVRDTAPPPVTLRTRPGRSRVGSVVARDVEAAKQWLVPGPFIARCGQCKLSFSAIVYMGPSGPAVALFPEAWGGVRTPHTPPPVAYYLDQAARAQSVGAYSAAMVMYPAALEHVLFEQGFRDGTCGWKVKCLERAVEEGTVPRWARDFDRRYLTVLKELGDGAVHTNDGDVARQAAFDDMLARQVEVTFAELLQRVYETPAQEADRLAVLQVARDKVSPPRSDRS